MLILDEPTSGVDPLARDRFWELLIDLSRNEGVTIFVSTHFMNEAERCDRISLMDAGRVLATGTPAELVRPRARRDARRRLHRLSRGGRRRARAPSRAATAAATPRPRRRGRAAASLVQPAAPVRLYDPRGARAAARPDPAGLRAARHGVSDAGVRLRHLDRRQQPVLRGARPRPDAREPRLSRGTARLDAISSRKPPLADDADLETPAPERRHQGRDRDSAGLRPRHQARTRRPRSAPGSMARCRSGRETIRGYLQRHAPAVIWPTRRSEATSAADRRRRPTIEVTVQLQSGFRQRLCHGAGAHGAAAGAVPGDPDGAGHRAREGARLDHQPLCHAGHAGSNSCSASSCPTSRSRWSISP